MELHEKERLLIKASAWILFNNLSGLACVDLETRLVGAIGVARSQMLGPKASKPLSLL